MERSDVAAAGATVFSVDPEEVVVVLRAMPLLQKVPEATLKKILVALEPLQIGPGEPIVQRDEEGAGLYIIWKGEVAVLSPLGNYPPGHTCSFLRSGDYFGTATTGRFKEKFKVDVTAVNEVSILVLPHKDADLLSASSVWDWESIQVQGPSIIERMLWLETIKPDVYRTYLPVPYRYMTGQAFGGQLVSQALAAATKSVKSGLSVHSLHCYFLQVGDEEVPYVYQVGRTREGYSFATRHVEAVQKNKIIFALYASFKREEEGLEHSELMPCVPGPEELPDLEHLYDTFLTDPRLPRTTQQKYAGKKLPLGPIELRYGSAVDRFCPVKQQSRHYAWFRSRGKLPEEQSLHRCVGAYASDLLLLNSSLRPHPETFRTSMQVLSLDHTIWFHRSFKADEWLLYVCESPVATDGRGLNFGRIYTQDGKLVMSVAQEGLLRKVGVKVPTPAKL